VTYALRRWNIRSQKKSEGETEIGQISDWEGRATIKGSGETAKPAD